MSDDVIRPIRPDVKPVPDVQREFLDFTRELIESCPGKVVAISVVVHDELGAVQSGCYSVPDLPVRWIAGAAGAVLSDMAARSGEDGPPW